MGALLFQLKHNFLSCVLIVFPQKIKINKRKACTSSKSIAHANKTENFVQILVIDFALHIYLLSQMDYVYPSSSTLSCIKNRDLFSFSLSNRYKVVFMYFFPHFFAIQVQPRERFSVAKDFNTTFSSFTGHSYCISL